MAHWWNHYPWRMIQPNFREIDTLNFDEERFLKELESFSCNAVMLNAAGLSRMTASLTRRTVFFKKT